MSDFALKWICRGYVGWAFSGIEREKVLNAAELAAIEPSAEMLSTASKPLAHMANRSKTLTKHGRFIIDSADGLESIIALGMWANTVRRIARSHDSQRAPKQERKKKETPDVGTDRTQSRGTDVPAESRAPAAGNGINGQYRGNTPGIGG